MDCILVIQIHYVRVPLKFYICSKFKPCSVDAVDFIVIIPIHCIRVPLKFCISSEFKPCSVDAATD
jgi:hypothetical protein